MMSVRQPYFHRHIDFTYFLCSRIQVMLIAIYTARGNDTAQVPRHTRSGNSITYHLTAGWNLVSIALNLDQNSKELLQGKKAMSLSPDGGTYTISGSLALSQACWIYCRSAETITLTGTLPKFFDFFATLKKGWNFVGPVVDISLSEDGAIAWGWNGHSFYQTQNLLAGHGYWLYWSSDYVAPREDTYLIVDLSGGSEATSYPVSYCSAPPLDGWTDEYKATKLVLRRIPAGTFMMGSPEGELGREEKEIQHQVTLTKDFYVGVFEVTQKQWALVKGNWPSYFNNPAYRDSRPVEGVSYLLIMGTGKGWGWPSPFYRTPQPDSFLGDLNDRTGLVFNLPTEAQWEYACRAGIATALNSDKNLTDKNTCPRMAEVGRYAWNGGNQGYAAPASDTAWGTAKVGSYLPNQWGLYDMHGNVIEWCLDWFVDGYPEESVTDPEGAERGTYRVCRGGAWTKDAHYCRSAQRSYFGPTNSGSNFYGFRIAMMAP